MDARSPPNMSGKSLTLVALMVCFVAGVFIGRTFLAPQNATANGGLARTDSIQQCMERLRVNMTPEEFGAAAMENRIDVCYKELSAQSQLDDFRLRTLKYLQQSHDQNVLLWMVVAITISGVALAAVQLLASFRLASAGRGELARDAELSIEQGRISLKSSVTGLLILVVSFAFFTVFVYEIYRLRDSTPRVEDREPQQLSADPVQPKGRSSSK